MLILETSAYSCVGDVFQFNVIAFYSKCRHFPTTDHTPVCILFAYLATLTLGVPESLRLSTALVQTIIS